MIIYSHGREGSKHPQMPPAKAVTGSGNQKKMLLEGSGQTALFFYPMKLVMTNFRAGRPSKISAYRPEFAKLPAGRSNEFFRAGLRGKFEGRDFILALLAGPHFSALKHKSKNFFQKMLDIRSGLWYYNLARGREANPNSPEGRPP